MLIALVLARHRHPCNAERAWMPLDERRRDHRKSCCIRSGLFGARQMFHPGQVRSNLPAMPVNARPITRRCYAAPTQETSQMAHRRNRFASDRDAGLRPVWYRGCCLRSDELRQSCRSSSPRSRCNTTRSRTISPISPIKQQWQATLTTLKNTNVKNLFGETNGNDDGSQHQLADSVFDRMDGGNGARSAAAPPSICRARHWAVPNCRSLP